VPFKAVKNWRRNVFFVCAAQLLTLLGFTSYFPFIPYYFQELGATSEKAAMSWLAAFNSGAALSMMVAAPIWGGLADRYGRKLMLMRATAAGAILALFMGMAQAPWHLVALRILQGFLCGTVSASITLVATSTPEAYLATGLGMIQMVQYGGQALGPLIGGVLADTWGYRAVFPISAGLMFASLALTMIFVRETRRSAPRSKDVKKKSRLAFVTRSLVIMLISVGSIRFGMGVLSPVLSLYVKSLSAGQGRLATLAGSVVSVAAFSSAIAAVSVGSISRRLGHRKLLLLCCLGVAVLYVPQAFVRNVAQLLILRAVMGFFLGGMMPTANALLATATPQENRGTVFGLSTSVQAAARAIGPAIGAGVAGTWGMPSVFLVTAGIYGLVGGLVAITRQQRPPLTALEKTRARKVRVCSSHDS